MEYGSNLNNTQGSFNGIFKTASASVGTTKAETDDFKLDVVSVFSKNKSNTAPLLKYPYDIDNSRIKENKTLKLFILKDAAYQKIVAAAVDGADKFLKSSAAGIEAGLPEISGTSWNYTPYNRKNSDFLKGFSGALHYQMSWDSEVGGSSINATINQPGVGDNELVRKQRFNASKSNPIYGNSNTVQPPAYTVFAWLRVA